MRLLVVVDYFDDPPVIGSTVIAYHWVRVLHRRGHAVDLVCARQDWDARWAPFYREHGLGRPALPGVPWRGRVAQLLASLSAWVPPSVAHVRARALASWLAPRGKADHDAAVVIGPALLPLAEALREACPTVFVPVDAISMVLESRRPRGVRRPSDLRWAVEARMWRRLERRRFPRLDAVVFVADADARAATRGWPEAARRRVHVIPNGVDADHFRPMSAPTRPAGLVFTGNLWSADSVLGARWFVDAVLPRIADAVPGVTLRMVGRDPAPALRALARRDPRVEIHANVPDLRPYLDEAAVYVCPLVSGGGVKNRLLEALAMGKATVATTACGAALGLESGRHLLLADAPADFAAAVVRLLREPEARAALGAAGRAIVLDRFGWDAGVERLERIIDGLG
ncbi:MAG TPA: glycosyltransferase family 4 protein [Longimicrobiales bacterium]